MSWLFTNNGKVLSWKFCDFFKNTRCVHYDSCNFLILALTIMSLLSFQDSVKKYSFCLFVYLFTFLTLPPLEILWMSSKPQKVLSKYCNGVRQYNKNSKFSLSIFIFIKVNEKLHWGHISSVLLKEDGRGVGGWGGGGRGVKIWSEDWHMFFSVGCNV